MTPAWQLAELEHKQRQGKVEDPNSSNNSRQDPKTLECTVFHEVEECPSERLAHAKSWIGKDAFSGCDGADFERTRAQQAWQNYMSFLAAPGHKCADCWLLKKHCCCDNTPHVQLRPRVVVFFHYLELGKHLCSNTAKLLLQFGAELFTWGLEDQERQLENLIKQDRDGTVVLFPSPDAVDAHTIANDVRSGVLDGACSRSFPRCIVILDGGWRECKRMNDWIDPQVMRCRVSTATRKEFGGTRKYGPNDCGKSISDGRVQTAAAFIALLHELGEDPSHVAAVRHALSQFMASYETQIARSKT